MSELTSILQCPVTHRPLRLMREDLLASDQNSEYRVLDGIAVLLPPDISTSANIIEYYDSFGWVADPNGASGESKTLLDTRKAPYEYTKKCISRLEKYFVHGGDYLLDVGCGPIAHKELMSYHSRFQKRICLDLSITALQRAKSKLGDRGVYIVGDAAKLPLADETIDAISCTHLLYQLPSELQAAATKELWRVLKPGGIAVIVYKWPYSGIAARLEKLARKLGLGPKEVPSAPQDASAPMRDPDHPQSRSWFEAQNWPFRYSYDCYRMVDNGFMRRYVDDGWRGRLFLAALYAAQVLLPETCGKYGTHPAIIIRKPEAAPNL